MTQEGLASRGPLPGLLIDGAGSLATMAGGLRRGTAQGDAAERTGPSLSLAAWQGRILAAGPSA